MKEIFTKNKAQSTGAATRGQAERAQVAPAGLLHLSIIYVIWGSTYLAIRVAVREGAGFPPFTLSMTRVLLAGTLLLILGVLRRKSIRPSREDLLVLLGSGLLLWTGGNGLVTWAEQRADSGLAAMIVATTPIWTALMEAILDRRLPTLRLVLALLVGFAGILLLSVPSLRTGMRADVLAILALLGAPISWAAGSILQNRRQMSLEPQVSAGYQSLFGGLGFLVLVLVFREPRPVPTNQAWLAWGYLVLFGSVIGFTSYVQVLKLLPMSIAMTYAYVNPVIAVLLGALILGEPITLWTISGAVLVILGVAGVFRDRSMRTRLVS
ncbi:MAG: EamA family transporter [Anaerolineaceae bacterium]|nr:MAG: EamA family transporter [Anaerolineaceae bacterium]